MSGKKDGRYTGKQTQRQTQAKKIRENSEGRKRRERVWRGKTGRRKTMGEVRQ